MSTDLLFQVNGDYNSKPTNDDDSRDFICVRIKTKSFTIHEKTEKRFSYSQDDKLIINKINNRSKM